jgi:hypothetical protein
MPSTYTSRLRLEKQATGENDNTWGALLDTLIDMLDAAIAGRSTVVHDDTAAYTLTTANGTDDEARNMFLNITGALTAARNAVVPTVSKLYFVKNGTTGGFAVTVKTSAGTGISVPNGKSMLLACDGTNVVNAIDYLAGMQLVNPAYLDQTLVDGATVNWDMDSGGIGTLTLGGSRTMAAPTNLKKGVYILHVVQDATGSRTITWNAVFKWPAGVAPVLSTGAAKRDILSFVCDGTNLYGSYMLDLS